MGRDGGGCWGEMEEGVGGRLRRVLGGDGGGCWGEMEEGVGGRWRRVLGGDGGGLGGDEGGCWGEMEGLDGRASHHTGYIGNKSGSFVTSLEYRHDDHLIPHICPRDVIMRDRREGGVEEREEGERREEKVEGKRGVEERGRVDETNEGEGVKGESLGEVVKRGDVLNLASCTTSFVFVDKDSRKAVEAPPWWKDKYVPLSSHHHKLGPQALVDIPKKGG